MNTLYSWERDSLEGPHDAETMERSAPKRERTPCVGTGRENQRKEPGQKQRRGTWEWGRMQGRCHSEWAEADAKPDGARTEKATFTFSGPTWRRYLGDHPSRWPRVLRKERAAPSGPGEEDQMARSSAQSECSVPQVRALAKPSTHRTKRAGPRTEPCIRFEMSGFEHHGRGPPGLTERIGSSEQSKAEDLESVVCEREQRARPNQKLYKNQWWPK